jgi:hypothetical protein
MEIEVKKMNLKETGSKFIFAIPHFSELFNMRRNQRYAPNKELGFEIKIKDAQDAHIDGKVFDISFDGMKLITSDQRIKRLKAISLSAQNLHMEVPCKMIWQDGCYYGIEFGSIDQQEFDNIKYFIENFIKTAPDNLLELLM